jgi:hypothetical protein
MSRRAINRFSIDARWAGRRDIVHVVERTRNAADVRRGTPKSRLQDVLLAGAGARQKGFYVQRGDYQHAVRSTQLSTLGHSPARDIVNFLVARQKLRRAQVSRPAVMSVASVRRMRRVLQPVEADTAPGDEAGYCLVDHRLICAAPAGK